MAGAGNGSALSGLLPGTDCTEWMRAEVDTLTGFVHQAIAGGQCAAEPAGEAQAAGRTMNDGGEFEDGVIRRFSRNQRLASLNQFFSPYRSWTRQP